MEIIRDKGRGFTLLDLLLVIALIGWLLMVPAVPQAMAGGNAGVWPVELRADDTVLSSGLKVYVIDLTAKNHYTGNIIVQFSGLTFETLAADQDDSGVTVSWAHGLISSDADDASWDWTTWTAVTNTGAGTLYNSKYLTFDIAADPAAPYVAIKFELSGASAVKFGAKYSTSGNP